MARPIDPEKLVLIKETIMRLHKESTISEIARLVGTSPSSVRHHGLAMEVTFTKRWSTNKKVYQEGKFFNESHRENWLI